MPKPSLPILIYRPRALLITHPSSPVDQVIEFGDNILSPAGGDVGFFLDDGRALFLDLGWAENKQR